MEVNQNVRFENTAQHPSAPPSYSEAVRAQPFDQTLSGAISTQPFSTNSNAVINAYNKIPNCPRGLEYLTTVDQLLIKQQVNGQWDTKFVIKNSSGQNVYWANEEADCCGHCCCGANREFDMKITDIHNNLVMHFYRPTRIGFQDSIEVSAPVGQLIGRVVKEISFFPTFKIKNHKNETVLRIEGPAITTGFFSDVEFKVLSLDGIQVGRISKQWACVAREFFTDADFFGINFPMDLDVRIKAVLLGACLLINSDYYESN